MSKCFENIIRTSVSTEIAIYNCRKRSGCSVKYNIIIIVVGERHTYYCHCACIQILRIPIHKDKRQHVREITIKHIIERVHLHGFRRKMRDNCV